MAKHRIIIEENKEETPGGWSEIYRQDFPRLDYRRLITDLNEAPGEVDLSYISADELEAMAHAKDGDWVPVKNLG